MKTTNGGTNWTQQTSPVTNTLSCLYFPPSATSMIGYASGGAATAGTVLKTNNAGVNWTLDTVGTNWLFGIYFSNLMTGWAVGFNGVIYKTSDGGSIWVLQISNTTNRLVAVSFPSLNTGYAVGYTGTIVKSTNGGDNWFVQFSPSPNNFWGVCFTDENTGWAAGWNGTILHTTNGGVTFVKRIGTEVPGSFALHQNYPNPFNPSTKIKFEIPLIKGGERSTTRLVEGLYVVLKIYDILGNEIETLVNDILKPGSYEVEWSAAFGAGNRSSGVYFYRLTAGNYSLTKTMVLLK